MLGYALYYTAMVVILPILTKVRGPKGFNTFIIFYKCKITLTQKLQKIFITL